VGKKNHGDSRLGKGGPDRRDLRHRQGVDSARRQGFAGEKTISGKAPADSSATEMTGRVSASKPCSGKKYPLGTAGTRNGAFILDSQN